MRGHRAKWILVALVFCMSLPLAFAQSSTAARTPKKGGTLNVAVSLNFQSLDWQATTADPTKFGMAPIFEGLFAFGKDFKPQPELVDTYKVSADSLTWTFELRKGVLFHNGNEVTAEDVKASLQRWRKVSPSAANLASLKDIFIDGKYTVRMVFEKPMGSFLMFVLANDLTKAIIMPKAIADSSPQAGALTQIIGSGPYMFDEYKPDNYLRLKRFEKYVARTDPPNYQAGKKIGYVDFIYFYIVPEATTRVAGMETGQYDIINNTPEVDYERLKSVKGVEPVIQKPPVLTMVLFNQKAGPFAKLEMRQAVQALVNAKDISRSMVANPDFSSPDISMGPPGTIWYSTAGSQYLNGGIAQAKSLMAKAGYAGEKIKFIVLRPEPTHYRTDITLSEAMKAAGMNVELILYDLGTWAAARREPDQMDIFTTENASLDPMNWQTFFGGKWPGEKTAFPSIPETEQLFQQLIAEVDFNKRFSLNEKLQELLYKNVAVVPGGYHHRLNTKRSEVIDPEGNIAIGNLTLNNVWLDRPAR
jgi:peptide/nickel transport system substrate-binding protein